MGMVYKIHMAFGRRVSRHGIFINLGTGHGRCKGLKEIAYLGDEYEPDPANCLVEQGHGGVMFEGDSMIMADLKQHFRGRNDIELQFGWVHPASARDAVADSLRRLKSGREHFAARPKAPMLR